LLCDVRADAAKRLCCDAGKGLIDSRFDPNSGLERGSRQN